jgi:hypothetical protein
MADEGLFIKYKTIDGGTRGLLGEDLSFQTDILGFEIELVYEAFEIEQVYSGSRCTLTAAGVLTAYTPFVWDFGTFAVDTPDMVVASVAHDIICWMTDEGKLPWKYRAYGDRLFRELLKKNNPGKGKIGTAFNFTHRWLRWLGVRANSKFNAYWRAKKYEKDADLAADDYPVTPALGLSDAGDAGCD